MNPTRTHVLLTLPLLLAACGSASLPSASNATVTADRSVITLTPDGASTPADAAVNFTFTNRAGATAVSVGSATVTYGKDGTLNVPLPGFTIPAGLSCADGSTSGCSTANLQFTEKTFARTIADAALFGKLPGLNPGASGVPVSVTFPGVSGALNFTVNVAAPAGAAASTPASAPAPVLIVNGAAVQPYKGNLNVTVSGNFDAASTIDKLILQVTDADGTVDNTTYVSNQPTSTFSVDTSKLPDGTVTLQAIALTKADAAGAVLRGKSATKTVTVQNITAPVIQISAPLDGSAFTGATLPVNINLTRKNSAFTVTGGALTVDLLDYRGQSVAMKTIAGVTDNVSGTYSTSFDVAGLPADRYTVRVQGSVTVAGGAAQTSTTVATVTIGTQSINPPAVVIRIPAALRNPADTSQPLRATLNSSSAVLLQMSDDKGVVNVQARLVRPDGVPLNAYLFNIGYPAPVLGPVEVVVGPFDIDGSQYVPNGPYTLRMTVTDTDGNRNIQEVPVTIDRANTVTGTVQSAQASPQPPITTPGKLNYTSGAWTLSNLPTTINKDLSGSTRVAGLLYRDATLVDIKRLDLTGESSITDGTTFTAPGDYRVDWLVQDLTSGTVTYLSGTQHITVIQNP